MEICIGCSVSIYTSKRDKNGFFSYRYLSRHSSKAGILIPEVSVKSRKSLPSDLIEGRLCLTFSSQTIIVS